MLPKSLITLSLYLLASSQLQETLAREQWLERAGRAVYLYPRRFGQEQPAVLNKLREACPGNICGTLAGAAVTPLLAAQPECSQQDLADQIIDASKQFDAATQANMIAIAQEYRQTEKNTPPDFSTNPPTARNSVFCQKAPKNPELNGLVQAQDPANDPDLFFDPATKATVRKGEQANTFPFGEAGGAAGNGGGAANQPAPPAATTALPAEVPTATGTECVTAVTVTVTATATVSDSTLPTVVVGGGGAAEPAPTASVGDADFGSCSVPEIEFGQGFDGRKETSFQPVDKASFTQGSAQNIDIITRSICDTLVNKCGANQAAKDLCATGQAAASAFEPKKTGGQADAFNAAFGKTTNFAAVQAFDDQGRAVEGTGAPVADNGGAADNTDDSADNTDDSATDAGASTGNTGNTGAGAGIGNFGSCSVPQIKFAQGLDNRKETAFEPADKASFNHGSAQNIDIITQFICDTLTNTCDADATAKATCETARAAASAATKGSGGQADAFNAAFGITTNFNAIAAIDNQGRVVGSTAAPNVPAAGNQNNNQNNNGGATQNNGGAANQGNQNTGNTGNTGGAAQGGNLQTFSGALGGVVAPTVTELGDGRFQVTGNAAFNNIRSARVRSCDVQNNQCANAANSSGNRNFSVSQCNAQQAECIALADSQ